MWNYEKRLEYPINIKRTDAAMAKAIISQFGGPDGETGAAMRYLSQRFAIWQNIKCLVILIYTKSRSWKKY